MGQYSDLESSIFSIFNKPDWISKNIKTFPNNYVAKEPGEEFLRVSILPSGAGINIASKAGLIIIDLFTPAGEGPNRASLLADSLDEFLVGKMVDNTQMQGSSMQHLGIHNDNPTLFHSQYSIPFNYFGVK
jgi:hypothetical protein